MITNAYPPRAYGGAGEVAARLVRLWRASGHEVRVWQKRAAWLERSFARRIMGHLFDAVCADPEIVASIQGFKPDLVISHNLTGLGLRTAYKAARTRRAPWIHILHDIQLFEPSGQALHDRSTWLQRCATLYRRVFWRDPDIVVSPTQWLARAHAQRGWFLKTSIAVIPNPSPWEEAARPSMVGDYYLFVGRWSHDKGADVVRVMAAESSYPFVAIGPGTDGISEKQIQGKGALTHEELGGWFAHARAVVVPSQILENQPNVILEAFSFGVPVIASALGGIPETVGDAGILCAPQDSSLWRRAIVDVERDLVGYHDRALARAKAFATKRISPCWEDLFRQQRRTE